MIWINRQYKWIDFTDSVQYASRVANGYGVFIQNEVHWTTTRTDVFDRANYHGGYSSETLAGGRLFTFDCIAVWSTKAQRNTIRNTIVAALQPEPNPWASNRGFYDLDFDDDWWNARTVKAKVFTPPTPTNDLDDPLIRFTFELYAEEEKIYWDTEKTTSGTVGYLWGFTLSTPLPYTTAWYINIISVTNAGNRAAPFKMQLLGEAVNPKIINLTNGNKYRIEKTTTNYIFDNRNLNNLPTERLVVMDNWLDIRAYRSSGASIYLDPWVNELVVITDNHDTTNTVEFTFRDSYLY